MSTVEQGWFTPKEFGDSGGLPEEPPINIKQMERNGVTLIDFKNPPEGIELIGEPFPASDLWSNLSRRPRPQTPRRRNR